MIFVACSGFPVPVSRYWAEFPAVEITETELGLPGEGTVRRWIRESPASYVFALRAPQEITVAGFQVTKDTKKLVDAMGKLAQSMEARAVVFLAPEGFKPSRAARTAVRDFVGGLAAKYPPVVLDLPLWTPEQVLASTDGRKVIVAYDPLVHTPPPTSTLAYVRLPGPAGHRSRYDDASIDRIAKHCLSLKAVDTICVFRNIDMHANATTLRKKIGA